MSSQEQRRIHYSIAFKSFDMVWRNKNEIFKNKNNCALFWWTLSKCKRSEKQYRSAIVVWRYDLRRRSDEFFIHYEIIRVPLRFHRVRHTHVLTGIDWKFPTRIKRRLGKWGNSKNKFSPGGPIGDVIKEFPLDKLFIFGP